MVKKYFDFQKILLQKRIFLKNALVKNPQIVNKFHAIFKKNFESFFGNFKNVQKFQSD